MLKFLKDIIAPKKCYSCNKEGHFLCIKCLSMMSNFDSICYVCKGKSNNFDVHEKCLGDVYYDKVIILSHYKNKVISKLIKDFKFYGRKDIGEDFGIYLTNMFFDNEVYKNTDNYIILYPPMGFFKSLKRGYNHSKFLAKVISTETGIKLENTMLKKVRQTGQQSKLSRQERLNNLQDSFKIHKNKIDNIDKKIFIVIDDVISTGSTLNEISRVLKHAGAKKVIGLIVASD
ncbi:MAG: ComF family protein [Candidatus Gracilibacteria bacterium]|nr:ComF family protein [Candidatus Gracilibacteria bacterium]